MVDTEDTGKQLLQKGGLRKRVTIIPLNKIQTHPVQPRYQNAATRLVSHCNFHDTKWPSIGGFIRTQVFILQVGKGNAEVAISLVGYDEELKVCQ